MNETRRDDIYQFDDAEIAEHPIVQRMVRDAVAARDAEIREALLSTDHEGPVHKAMSVWTVAEHLYRQNSEGEPTHEAAMAFATAAIEQALIVAGLAEKGAER